MLLIDAGNSRCKWACVEAGVWTRQGAVDNAEWMLLQQSFAALPNPGRIVVSNVAGEMMARNLHLLCARWETRPDFLSAQSAQCGVINSYEHPSQLGSDRWAALIASWDRMHRACLVVNCGTATTVDALSDTGEFLGGLILPGVALMRQSLAYNTAQLSVAEGCLQDFPRNTQDAIQSGILRATVEVIRFQYALIRSTQTVMCLLTGGAARQIEMQLGMPLQRVDNLVLQGLQIIGENCA